MSSIKLFSARQALLGCIGLTGLAALSGCSLFHGHARPEQAAPPPPVAQEQTPAVQAPQTAVDAATGDITGQAQSTGDVPLAQDAADTGSSATAATDQEGTTTVLADAASALKPTAPKNYVVQHGDTLWGIANMFLRSPWEWPEIWYVNPEIHNPHRIYPGDSVRLALAGDGRTELQLVRGPAGRAAAAQLADAQIASARLEPLLRSSPLDTPIETIPYGLISAFISHPGVLTREQIASAAYIVALAENHDIAGTGHELFVKKVAAPAGSRFSVMHVDEALTDPDSGRHLGYVAIYAGTAQITQSGPIAKAVVTSSARETLQGDLLIPEEQAPTTDFVPHAPPHPVAGRIINVIDNVLLAGQYQVVALNRGTNDGLDRGSVLTVDQAAVQVPDLCAAIDNTSTCTVHRIVTLPTDTAGTVLVFRAFPQLSYALILDDTVPVQVGDRVRSP